MTICHGRNFLSRKVGGGYYLNYSVWECNYSNNNNGSVHSDKKLTRRREDAILHSHIGERRAIRWWLPLFGWSQADKERWADNEINESKTKGKAMEKSSYDDEKEMEEVSAKHSKLVRGRLTAEKEKILRKNRQDTSTFRDIMYHSAIASRLASPENERHG